MRGKNKYQNCWTIKNMYEDYINDKEYGSPYYVSFKEYYDICEDYHKWLVDQMVLESKTIKLPHRLGYVYILKRKPAILMGSQHLKEYPMNSLSIDWKESKRLGKWIHHINDHTGGYKYRFFWSKKACLVVNRELYRLVFSRTNKRNLAKAIKSGDHDYMEYK